MPAVIQSSGQTYSMSWYAISYCIKGKKSIMCARISTA